MKKILITVQAVFLTLGLFSIQMAMADSNNYLPPNSTEQGSETVLSARELDEILAPIALYPDPILAQILPAATFIDQIDLAARYIRQYGASARIDDQYWDVSVKALAHYPDVLLMMDQKYDWSISVGQAYISQPQDVMNSIQRLRAEAEAEGNLVSNSDQEVIDEGGIISIDPAEPDTIFVPQYDPLLVYLETPSQDYGFVIFDAGFAIGAWLNRDCDWHGGRIYYHGWQGGGWINRSRPHILTRNSVYINKKYFKVNTSKRVLQHDSTSYRAELRRNVQLHSNLTGHTVVPSARAELAAPKSTGIQPQLQPDISDVYRGRDIQRSQPASQTGYGGYGNGSDAALYRERGQSSRGTMQQFTRPVPVQRPAVSGDQSVERPISQESSHQAPVGGGSRKR